MDRQALRATKSRELLDEFRLLLGELALGVLPKSALATAIGSRPAGSGPRSSATSRAASSLPTISASERALPTVAIGRKILLFAGSDQGGRRAAQLYDPHRPNSDRQTALTAPATWAAAHAVSGG